MQQLGATRALAGWRRQAGFTLVEIFLVVALVAVLAGIALPVYQNAVTKARRSDAKAALLTVANKQESFMLDRSTYTDDMADLGFGRDPMVSEEGHYAVDAGPCSGGSLASCYQLTATPLPSSAQARDSQCANFTLDSLGNKSASGPLGAECW